MLCAFVSPRNALFILFILMSTGCVSSYIDTDFTGQLGGVVANEAGSSVTGGVMGDQGEAGEVVVDLEPPLLDLDPSDLDGALDMELRADMGPTADMAGTLDFGPSLDMELNPDMGSTLDMEPTLDMEASLDMELADAGVTSAQDQGLAEIGVCEAPFQVLGVERVINVDTCTLVDRLSVCGTEGAPELLLQIQGASCRLEGPEGLMLTYRSMSDACAVTPGVCIQGAETLNLGIGGNLTTLVIELLECGPLELRVTCEP